MSDVPRAARLPAGPKVRAWARKNGYPDWRAARLARLAEQPGAILRGLSVKPPTHLRLNPLRGDPRQTRKRLEAKGFRLGDTDLDPFMVRLRDAPMSPGATVEHLQGMTIPQDLASASAGLALNPKPGDVVADMAAAPGGKTVHLAGLMDDRGAIVAMDPDPARMRALRFNVERCGVSSAVLRQHQAEWVPGTGWADRVLLDAPCTGEGIIPRDRNRRRAPFSDIDAMCQLQAGLVDAADRVLRPGGVLVYATCALSPEENEGQVARLLARGYRMEKLPFDRAGDQPLAHGITEWPTLDLPEEVRHARRFYAGIHSSLGFFVARLRKPEDA